MHATFLLCTFYAVGLQKSKYTDTFTPVKGWWNWPRVTQISKPWDFVVRWSQAYQTFFLHKHNFFPFFAIKLGHFLLNTLFFICYKHSSLTAEIGKWRKTKFGRIDSRIKAHEPIEVLSSKTSFSDAILAPLPDKKCEYCSAFTKKSCIAVAWGLPSPSSPLSWMQ